LFIFKHFLELDGTLTNYIGLGNVKS